VNLAQFELDERRRQMHFTSILTDKKIHGLNVAAELSIGEYWNFAKEIIDSNEYQRLKVRTQGKTYELLKSDLIDGCVMPPIILAIGEKYGKQISNIIEESMLNPLDDKTKELIESIILGAVKENGLLILDGLQRTLTIQSCIDELREEERRLELFLSNKIRIEIYVGLSKTGILYRMLTLNTGQTPMSFRHQLEILYHDYLSAQDLPDGIDIVREADAKRARGAGKYKYQDVIDMFYAYSTGSPMPYDKVALVTELKEMKFLEDYEYRKGNDDMLSILLCYNHMLERIDTLVGDWSYTGDVVRPFGTNLNSVFSRPQPMAGFGAEIKRLLSAEIFQGYDDISGKIEKLRFSTDIDESLRNLITILDQIASKAKKIGDAQRIYFQYAFRCLLNPDSSSYLDLSRCWLDGQENFEMMF
jgi:hypothetical protein